MTERTDGRTPRNPFELSIDEVEAQVGDLGSLRLLQKRLYGDAPLRFRYAQSVITRTEAEVLGMSSPRFAIRAYLDPAGRSFVNLRRIKELQLHAPPWSARLTVDPNRQGKVDNRAIAPAITKTTP